MRGGVYLRLFFMEMLTMMKNYIYAGYQRQYEEGKQPEGAVEVKPVEVKEKKKTPANKSRKEPKNK